MVNDLENLQKEGFLVYAYVDDIALLVGGNFSLPLQIFIIFGNGMKTVRIFMPSY
jgi:hypothetical protein